MSLGRLGSGTRPADLWLLSAALVLTATGGLMVQAVSSGTAGPPAPTPPTGELLRHAIYAAVGVVAMLVAMRIDYRALQPLAMPLYAVSLASLLLVLVMGSSQFGARRWIDLGLVTVQPSEFAKLASMLALAAFVSGREPTARALLLAALLVSPAAVLVLVEPDLGSTLVFVGSAATVMVVWGTSWRLLGGVALTFLALGPLAFALAVPAYQRERLVVFFDPGHDPLGSGFTLRQVEVALGAGGLSGRGFFSQAASALDGLATRSSDFAFAELAAALGAVGGAAVIAMFAIVFWRGTLAAMRAPDRFGRSLAVGLSAVIAAQAFIHVAVNVRLFPATGIALPFVSQGGSSILAMFLMIGVLESIAARRPPSPREQWSGHRWR